MQFLVGDVGVTADRREVGVTEVGGDQAGVAGRLAKPRRGGMAERVCGYVLVGPGAVCGAAYQVGEDC